MVPTLPRFSSHAALPIADGVIGSSSGLRFGGSAPRGTRVSARATLCCTIGSAPLCALQRLLPVARPVFGHLRCELEHAQEVVKKGIKEGKRIARGVADQAVKAGVEYLPEPFRGPGKKLRCKM